MSNVNIYEKNWIDLVFEDKNKAYGAYQLRQENPRTSLFAFLGGISLILLLLGGWFIFSAFGTTPVNPVLPEDPYILTPVELNTLPQPIKPKAPETTAAAAASENKVKKYEASKTPDNVDVPKTTEPSPTPTVTGTDTGTAPAVTPSTEGGGPVTVIAPAAIPDNRAKTTNELDVLPKYPGGIDKFYRYVSTNFEKPEVDEHYSSVSVIMSFVIEKDGSMTDIKVMRSSDKNMEREAIRVLKSLKVKWEPGMKDGEKVRTLYLLPIKVAL